MGSASRRWRLVWGLSLGLWSGAGAQTHPFVGGAPLQTLPQLGTGAALPLPQPGAGGPGASAPVALAPGASGVQFGAPRASHASGVTRLVFDLPAGVRYGFSLQEGVIRVRYSGAALKAGPLPAAGYTGGLVRAYLPMDGALVIETSLRLSALQGWRATEAALPSGSRVLVVEVGAVDGGAASSTLFSLDPRLSVPVAASTPATSAAPARTVAAPDPAAARMAQLMQSASALATPVLTSAAASGPALEPVASTRSLPSPAPAPAPALAAPAPALPAGSPTVVRGQVSGALTGRAAPVRMSTGTGVTRLVIDLPPGVSYAVQPGGDGLKLQLSGTAADFSAVRPSDELLAVTSLGGGTWQLRAARQPTARSGWDALVLPRIDGEAGARLVIDLSPALADRSSLGGARLSALPRTLPGLAALGAQAPRPRVVLDPGHGGIDPGAVGRIDGRELLEKQVTLDIAKRVERLLIGAGFDVTLTRTGDRELHPDKATDLRARSDLSAKVGAEMFVSIHVNALAPVSALKGYGVETWWNPNHPFSHRLASTLQSEMVASTAAYSRGIRNTQSLGVLRSNSVPAALVEIGFASHPVDAQNLISEGYLDRVAFGIASGIRAAYLQGVMADVSSDALLELPLAASR